MTLFTKYARIENERRFLLPSMEEEIYTLPKRVILDHYIVGTNLRLRLVDNEDSKIYKLTKKFQLSPGREQITTIYLSQEEYELLSKLQAIVVRKPRFIMQYKDLIIGIDVYENEKDKLWLAEIEFETTEDMNNFKMPIPYQIEVTDKEEFSGFVLATRFGILTRCF